MHLLTEAAEHHSSIHLQGSTNMTPTGKHKNKLQTPIEFRTKFEIIRQGTDQTQTQVSSSVIYIKKTPCSLYFHMDICLLIRN